MRKSGNKIKPWKCPMFSQYLYWENNTYTMKSWINQRWWSAKVNCYKNALPCMLGLGQVLPWECQIQKAAFIIHIPTERPQAKHNSNIWTCWQTQWPYPGKTTPCHRVRVLKNTVQGWHRFTRYVALKELSSLHIKIQISWCPACRFYLLSDV